MITVAIMGCSSEETCRSDDPCCNINLSLSPDARLDRRADVTQELIFTDTNGCFSQWTQHKISIQLYSWPQPKTYPWPPYSNDTPPEQRIFKLPLTQDDLKGQPDTVYGKTNLGTITIEGKSTIVFGATLYVSPKFTMGAELTFTDIDFEHASKLGLQILKSPPNSYGSVLVQEDVFNGGNWRRPVRYVFTGSKLVRDVEYDSLFQDFGYDALLATGKNSLFCYQLVDPKLRGLKIFDYQEKSFETYIDDSITLPGGDWNGLVAAPLTQVFAATNGKQVRMFESEENDLNMLGSYPVDFATQLAMRADSQDASQLLGLFADNHLFLLQQMDGQLTQSTQSAAIDVLLQPELDKRTIANIALADIDKDGLVDIIVAPVEADKKTTQELIIVSQKNETSGFTSIQHLSLFEAAVDIRGLSIADIDGDSLPDLAISTIDHVRVYHNINPQE